MVHFFVMFLHGYQQGRCRTRGIHCSTQQAGESVCIVLLLGSNDCALRPPCSLPDTFWLEKTRKEKEEANETVSTKRKENISLEGRSQWMHRSHYGRTGESKSRSCCQECTHIRRKRWPCVCWA